MKKIVILFFAVVTVNTSYAQTEKGKKMIGGQMNFAVNDDKNSNKVYDCGISPDFGYFIKDNLAVGINATFSQFKIDQGDRQTINTNYGGGGFARYHFALNDKLKFYLNGKINYIQGKSLHKRIDSPNSFGTANVIVAEISPGLVYFATPKFGIQTSVGSLLYQNFGSKSSGVASARINGFRINFNSSSINLGVNYYF